MRQMSNMAGKIRPVQLSMQTHWCAGDRISAEDVRHQIRNRGKDSKHPDSHYNAGLKHGDVKRRQLLEGFPSFLGSYALFHSSNAGLA